MPVPGQLPWRSLQRTDLTRLSHFLRYERVHTVLVRIAAAVAVEYYLLTYVEHPVVIITEQLLSFALMNFYKRRKTDNCVFGLIENTKDLIAEAQERLERDTSDCK